MNYYVSTGLILNEFLFKDDVIKISACAKDTYIKVNKYIFTGKGGTILHEQVGDCGTYRLTGNEEYVRVQVISEHGAMLWTQPIYKKELFIKP